MLPRLRIYQLNDVPGGALFEEMREGCRRLRAIILTPALIAVWGLGLLMTAINPSLWQQPWFLTKLALAAVVTGFHGYFIALGKAIDRGERPIDAKRLRLLNEGPFLAMAGIIILVIAWRF